MPQSSESIAALAGALAKAQPELLNPEKSLTAVIATDRAATGRSFRYAPLSSGLEIVRKTLGKHELSVVQTTTIDEKARLLRLTTVLAHSSGEWIASDWPVCSLAEVGLPHRMGTALTYARRYSLFALVGIAGEDDLDTPDAKDPSAVIVGTEGPVGGRNGHGGGGPHDLNGANGARVGAVANGAATQRAGRLVRPPRLEPSVSAVERDRLIEQCMALGSLADATAWAQLALKAKNTLTEADADALEKVFERKLAELGDDPGTAAETVEADRRGEARAPDQTTATTAAQPSGAAATGIDKGALALAEPRRRRDKEHLRFVTTHACLICGRKPSDAHHLRFAQPRAMSRKVSDEFTVPLCRLHHREVHRCGNESQWWSTAGIDPLAIAERLWKKRPGRKRSEDRAKRDAEFRQEMPATPVGPDTEANTGAGPVS